MHEELEATLRELEAKLPDLRHLIAESGVVLTTSPAALVLGARLLRAITAADEVASLLRLTLLNGGELVVPTAQAAEPVAPQPVPAPPAPPEPEPPSINPAEITATGNGLTDSDYALQEALGLIPDTTTSFGEAIGDLEQSAEEGVSRSTEAELPSFVDDLSDETLRNIERVMAAEADRERQWQDLSNRINAAIDVEDIDLVRELTAQRKEIERQISRPGFLAEHQQSLLGDLAEKLKMRSERSESTSEPREVLRDAFRLTGHHSLETFEEIRAEYTIPLESAIRGYVQTEDEVKFVAAGTLAHAARVWQVAEGEVSSLELLASLAVEQIERLLPRSPEAEERLIPTPKQIFRYLARHRVERLIEDMERQLERLRIGIQESIHEVPASTYQEIATLEQLRNEVMRQFYNGLLRLDDDDSSEGDAMGARITPPLPVRGPGAGRTFDEALALARNP